MQVIPCQKARYIDPVFFQCLITTVYNAGPTFEQHFVNVSWLLGGSRQVHVLLFEVQCAIFNV